ncbi:hypothetical protein GE061_000523 [Apolygus lucorum]|uniref:Uncharacterized protein n=1 Tax=Apolygus lucorum TaxID=248454 RepID=A0A8S9Y4U2_APOLU|nr:hypothetical protein GE061_000523 [Apolygus lucorum]
MFIRKIAVTMMVLAAAALLIIFGARLNSFVMAEGHPLAVGGIDSYTHEIEDLEDAMTVLTKKASEIANEFASLTYSLNTMVNKPDMKLFDVGAIIDRERKKLEEKVRETQEAVEKTWKMIVKAKEQVGDVVQAAA